MGKRVSEKNRCITVNLHHDGVFTVSPFEYAFGDEKQITDIHFEGTLLKLGIKIIKTISDVDEFVNFGYRNKWQVNLHVEHSGYDALDIKDQEETMADDGNESSDAYFSSDEEDLSYVDFHTEVDENVIIRNVTTNDPFLNKLCPNNAHFLNVLDEPVFENIETVVEDSENIDPKFNVKSGVTYIRHYTNQNWKKMEPVLGMRFDNPEQLKMCLANYGYEKKKKIELDENESLNVNKVITRSRLKIDEGTSKSPKTPVKAITFEPIIAVTPSVEPTASATHSTDKVKQVAELQGKKKGSKRKEPASSEEAAENQRIIFHKNMGRSKRIFNQKMKKSGFGPNGEGST
nr:zinc finger, PMZ-type [Tanacetum cinerariifolium]GEY32788.1 zinc finger, PMZ-type [Tanacetum cinerariifolium]